MPSRLIVGKRDAARRRKKILAYGLLLIIGVGLIPAGASSALALKWLMVAIVLLAAVASFIVPLGRAKKTKMGWLPLCFGVMGGISLLQLLVVPCGWLEVLAPKAYEAYSRYATIFSEECWGAISVNRSQTMLVAFWWFTLAAWAWMLIITTHKSIARTELLGTGIIVLILAEACYGLVMLFSGIELGAYFEAKVFYRGDATGTLVNRNHFAAIMYIAAALAFPVLIENWRSRNASPGSLGSLVTWLSSNKVLFRLALVIFVIAAVNSHSRMGNTALALGVTACCLIAFIVSLQSNRAKKVRSLGSPKYLLFLFTSILLLDLFVVSNWFGLEKVVERIDNTTVEGESRTRVFADIVESGWITQAKLAGTGAGSFEVVYREYEGHVRQRRFNHAHNDWLQFWLEYGSAGALVLGFGLLCFLRQLRNIPTQQAIAALSLVIMLGLHATVEFALRTPVVALLAVAVLTTLLADRPMPRAPRSRRRRLLPDQNIE